MMNMRDNPFPREAVATYGKTLKVTADKLSYMLEVTKKVDEYLGSYFEPKRRYGGGVGLRGGHGSGKTHLLYWQAERLRGLSTPGASVAYAKADSNSFFDLHKQFMTHIGQLRLFEVVGLARKNVAISEVTRAHATESMKERLKEPTDVQTLVDEGNLDALQLLECLKDRLKSSEVSESIPTALVHVDGSERGRKAFEWLSGEPAPQLEYIGVKSSLRQLEEEHHGTTAPDVVAIQTLEAIAALHELAERPLVLLIDQLEVLLRADETRRHTLHSLLKKLVEQVGSHGTLILIAGNEESWRLPRDIGPRLITREKPITVGKLTESETRILLEAYMGDFPEQFSPDAIPVIRRLSGGNPREILRIAHHAFNLTEGKVSQANEPLLIDAAEYSGSVADRERLALEVADQVLGEYGTVRTLVNLGNGYTVDRLLTAADGQPLLALLAVAATDRLAEVDSARQASETWDKLKRKWPQVKLIVVAIGYSSQEIRELFRSTSSSTLMFEDRDQFAGQLNTAALDLVAVKGKEMRSREEVNQELLERIDKLSYEIRQPANTLRDKKLLDMLEKITLQLNQIELQRSHEADQVEKRYTQSVNQLAESEMLSQRSKTAWGLTEQLDELENRLMHQDLIGERNLMRAMLVGNETSLQNQDFDFIGGLYIDLVSEELRNGYNRQLKAGRRDLISELHKVLRSKNTIDRLSEHPWKIALFSGVLAFVLTIFVLISIGIIDNFGRLPNYFYPMGLFQDLLFGLLMGIVVPINLFLLLNSRKIGRHRKWLKIANMSTSST